LAASRLNHPNCIKIYEFGDSGNDLFIAMEYLDGRSFDELLTEQFPLAHDRAADLMAQVCSALDEAHAQGIIHRDLKLENIMVVTNRSGEDVVKVLDFGIAKIQKQGGPSVATVTQAGHVAGTPEYMSPEQARGEKLDARADIYSLGVCVFHLVTGRLPYIGESPLSVVTQHLCDPIPVPSEVCPDLNILPQIDYLVLDCMAKDREERPETAAELGDRLRRLIPVLRGIDKWKAGGAQPSPAQAPAPNFHDEVVVSYEPDDSGEFLAEPTLLASDSVFGSHEDEFSAEPTSIVNTDYVSQRDAHDHDRNAGSVGHRDKTDPEVLSQRAYAEPALLLTSDFPATDDDGAPTFVGSMAPEVTDQHETYKGPRYGAGEATGAGSASGGTRKLLLVGVLVLVMFGVLGALGLLAAIFLFGGR
jgi:serine/threonine protein kinase